MKYLGALLFVATAALWIGRIVAGVKTGTMELKLYLPSAPRESQPVLFWSYVAVCVGATCLCVWFAALCWGLD